MRAPHYRDEPEIRRRFARPAVEMPSRRPEQPGRSARDFVNRGNRPEKLADQVIFGDIRQAPVALRMAGDLVPAGGYSADKLGMAARLRPDKEEGGRRPALFQRVKPVSYTHLRAHETVLDLVCRLLLEKKKTMNTEHLARVKESKTTTLECKDQ